jgi:hypothetical protein
MSREVIRITGPVRITPLDAEGNPCGPSYWSGTINGKPVEVERERRFRLRQTGR